MTLDINVYHVKILHRLNKNNGILPYNKMYIYLKGNFYYITTIHTYIEELHNINAIEIKNQYKLFEITNKGRILLEKNRHILEEAKKDYKKRSDYGIISNEQKNILKLLKKYIALKDWEKTRPIVMCKELGISNATVSKHFNNLKKLGYITFEPYRPYTIKIIKDVE